MKNFKKVYMIGIGGIGMSALARYFRARNVEVHGSDRDLESESVQELIKEGIAVYNQEEITKESVGILIGEADCVIYTVAIGEQNLELIHAKEKNIPMFTYAEMLGEISKDHFTIAVSGTHGKTTTTAMVHHIAKNLNLSPTTIVGSFLLEKNTPKTNFVGGNSDLFIVEACEYKRSFLSLHPNILIITNLEEDHLDYYKDLDDIKKAFFDLASKLSDDGIIVCDTGDTNLKEIVTAFSEKVLNYSTVENLIPDLKYFGKHNRLNAAAATSAISGYLNVKKSEILTSAEPEKAQSEIKKIAEKLLDFNGTWRRMEYKGKTQAGALVYDDYGHHPTEVNATIESIKENFPDKKLCVVFGPHLHSRTKFFFDEFVAAIAKADYSIIYPIYKARTEDDYGVSSELLSEKIRETGASSTPLDSFNLIAEEIEKLDDRWVVVLLGAGETYKIASFINLLTS